MKTTVICLGISLLFLGAANWSSAQTSSDIEKLMRAHFEKPAAHGADGRVGITINSIKVGQNHPANEQDVVNGVPPGAQVTVALVDFTTRTYYKSATDVLHRVREVKVYKDKFDELALMVGTARGHDESSREPAH